MIALLRVDDKSKVDHSPRHKLRNQTDISRLRLHYTVRLAQEMGNLFGVEENFALVRVCEWIDGVEMMARYTVQIL